MTPAIRLALGTLHSNPRDPLLSVHTFRAGTKMAAPNKPPRPAEVFEVITICMRYCRFHKTFPFLSSAEKLWNTFGAAGEARRSSRAIHTVLKWPHPSFLTTTYRSAKTSPSCKISTHGRGDRYVISSRHRCAIQAPHKIYVSTFLRDFLYLTTSFQARRVRQ